MISERRALEYYVFVLVLIPGCLATQAIGAEESPPAPVHYHFDAAIAADQQGIAERTIAVSQSGLTAGNLTGAHKRVNQGSRQFDGRGSIVYSHLPSNASGFRENFTWEGFFFSPAANTYLAETGIADRLISQFANDKGDWTRLAVGLVAGRKDGRALLCVELEGTDGRSFGRGTIEVTPDSWHHFAVVHIGTAGAAKISWYLDYELSGEMFLGGQADLNRLKSAGKAPFTIGARLRQGDRVNRGFTGLMDEIRLTPRPLSPDEFLRVRETVVSRDVVVRLLDDVPRSFDWDFSDLKFAESLKYEVLSLPGLPHRLSRWGTPSLKQYRGFVATHKLALPPARYRIRMRTRTPATLRLDGVELIDARDPHRSAQGERTAPVFVVSTKLDGKPHRFELAAVRPGGTNSSIGDVVVDYAEVAEAGTAVPAAAWTLLGRSKQLPPSSLAWESYRQRTARYLAKRLPARRRGAIDRENTFWNDRHTRDRHFVEKWPAVAVKAGRHPIDALLDGSVDETKPAREPVDDAGFYRRLSLDVRGRIPRLMELEAFLADRRTDKRVRAIDTMLASTEWADSWVGYWQDVLAENPSLVFPTLNNSGAFRQWVYDSYLHNMPFDQLATELIQMEGGQEQGTAGFALAAKNDVPLAMKGLVVMKAFLAVDLTCARCHDSPFDGQLHQRDLFTLAALLNGGPVKVPESSLAGGVSKPGEPAGLITTSLKRGEQVSPAWSFDWLVRDLGDSASTSDQQARAELAALVTSTRSPRFAGVAVNRVWKRYLGRGLVEPVDNWNRVDTQKQPPLLQFLARWFVESGYDMKKLARLMLTSQIYQSQVVGSAHDIAAGDGESVVPQRRMSAEQIVDSLFLAVGKQFESETMGLHATDAGAVNLPKPVRAWQFVALPNERGRPALAMPVSQTIVDVLATFGWQGHRQRPKSERDETPTALQPLILFNGIMSQRIVRLSEQSALTELCLQDLSVAELADKLFLTVLSRLPSAAERRVVVEVLAPSFAKRRTGLPKRPTKPLTQFQPDWRVHLQAKQTELALAAQKQVEQGELPTARLTNEFRERVEDVLWALVNSPEFVFIP